MEKFDDVRASNVSGEDLICLSLLCISEQRHYLRQHGDGKHNDVNPDACLSFMARHQAAEAAASQVAQRIHGPEGKLVGSRRPGAPTRTGQRKAWNNSRKARPLRYLLIH